MTTTNAQQRALVCGLGGVGGTVAAALASAGRSIVGVSGNATITSTIAAHGLRATSERGTRVVPLHVVTTPAEAQGPFDLAILGVPPDRLEAAARDVLPLLSSSGVVVTMANGLPEERIAPIVGEARVVGAIVGFGASMLSPGVVEQTSGGGLTIGRLDGSVDEELRRVVDFLAPVGAQDEADGITTNLRGARWSKLAINCAISSLGTIGGDRLGALMRHRFVRRLCLEVMTETTQVAQRRGVRLEKLAGMIDLEWIALDDDERMLGGSPSLLAKHTVLLAVGAKYRRLRSSMLAAIERGRTPPVDFLNGEVVARAASLGIAVPINAAMVATVKEIAAGHRTSSLETLQALYDDTRVQLRALHLAA